MVAMRILCILQNAWGDGTLPIVFKPNPFNKSAKIMRGICGDHVMHFSNTTPVVAWRSQDRHPIHPTHLKEVIKRAKGYDAVILCGKQALQAYTLNIEAFKALRKPIIAMQHPASRMLTIAERKAVGTLLRLNEDGRKRYGLYTVTRTKIKHDL